MGFIKTLNKLLPKLILLVIITFSNTSFGQGTCPASLNQWQWPTHTNWFSGKAQMMTFGADGIGGVSVSTKIGAGSPFTAYESCASASDEDGNLIIFTNGVKLWDGTGTEVVVPGGIKTGAENTGGATGSAVQGVFITKHPLNQNDYYIFTTDDAIGGAQNGITNGFNYFIYDKETNTCSAANRLGGYRCTEQVAGTFHQNGLDIWIVTHESIEGSTTNKYFAYLLECGGLNPVPVTTDIGFEVHAKPAQEYSNERASLEFAPNPNLDQNIKAGATFHCGTGTWDPTNSVSILDFDCLNGVFTSSVGFGDGSVGASNPYDCEFSADGSKLYVSFQADPWSGPLFGRLGEYSVASGAYSEIGNTGDGNVTIGSVKLGGDGEIYMAQFKSNGWAYRDDFITSNGSLINLTGLNASSGSVGYGLPNMFVPPQDWVEIEEPQPLTECDLPVNLETNWICKGTDAENTPSYKEAYSVATTGVNACTNCTVDPITGVFDAPDGAGTYEVYFEICDVKDTIVFVVGTCGCDADISNSEPICVGETFLLDTAVISASGDGIWTIDSVPSTPGVNALIDDSGTDTLFDASAVGTKYGVYKLMFRVDDSCEDSMYIEVKKIPTIIIDPVGPFCDDSIAVIMTAGPVLGGNGDVTAVAWQIDQGFPSLIGEFDPLALGTGVYSVKYGADSLGCINTDSIDVVVRERPHPEIKKVGPYCANDPAVTLEIIPLSADSGVWSGDADALGEFTPSNSGAGDHIINYTIGGQCGNDTTLTIHVDAVKNATIATPDSTICQSDPPIALLTGDLSGTWFVNDTTSGAGNELGGTSFDPAVHGAGEFNLIYYLADPCGDLDTVLVTVIPDKDATITSAHIDYCAVDTVFNLTSTNSGGVWFKTDTMSGSELGGITLNPTDHSGTFKLYYYISEMCGHVDSMNVTINPLKDATINSVKDTIPLCVLDANPTFSVIEAGGTWNNNTAVIQTGIQIEIDLATLGIVTNEMLIYTQSGPCGDKDTIWVTTTNKLDATITQVGPYCDSDPQVTLNVADPGGSFSGTGVDAATGVFDPVVAGDGIHTITYTIGGSCGDIQTIDIVVNRTPDPTITNTTFKFCEDHNDEVLTTAESGGVWREITNTNGGLNVSGAIFNTATSGDGIFELEYGFAGACPLFDTVEFVIDALPVITIIQQDTLCVDDAVVNLTASASISTLTTWSGAVNSTGDFDPKTATLGDNIVTFDAENGLCSATDFITIHVLKREDATIAFVDTACFTDLPFALLPLGTANGTWSGTGIIDTELGVFDPATAGVGTHSITHTINTRCGDIKTIDIEVVGPPDASIIEQSPVCAGSDIIQFYAATTPGGVWGGEGVSLDGTFNPTIEGDYEVTYGVTEGCFAQDDITFKVLSIPSTNFSVTPRTGCVPLTTFFTDESDEVPTQSSWDFGNLNVSNETSGTVSETYNTSGCYDVKLSNVYANGCKSDTTITSAVCLYALPEADFGWSPDVIDVDDNQVSFNDLSSSDVVSYEWDFTDIQLPFASDSITTASPQTSNVINPQVVFDSPNGDVVNVKLKVTNANGCVDSIIKPLTIIDKFSIFVPNAFTPNADGINDVFFPLGRNLIEGDDYDFRIYNRWGTLIWKSRTPYKGWDGTVTELAPSSGDCAQVDVYVWRLVVKDPFTGDSHKVFGTVSLIK